MNKNLSQKNLFKPIKTSCKSEWFKSVKILTSCSSVLTSCSWLQNCIRHNCNSKIKREREKKIAQMFLYWFTQPLGLRPVPCYHLQGFPLIQSKFTIKSHKPNLEPYKIVFYPLCSFPPHKMHTHSANAVSHCRFKCKHNNTTIELQVSPNCNA